MLTQIGLRNLTPLRAASISVPSTALAYLALSPVLLDLTGFTAGSTLLFALAGCLFPAAVTVLTFEGNRRVGPALAGALGNLSPLFAVLLALVLLGEVPSAGQLAGMAVILLGMLLIVGAPRIAPRDGFAWAIALLLLAAGIRGLVQPVVKLGLEAWPSPFAATAIGYMMSASTILSPAPCARMRPRRLSAHAAGHGLSSSGGSTERRSSPSTPPWRAGRSPWLRRWWPAIRWPPWSSAASSSGPVASPRSQASAWRSR